MSPKKERDAALLDARANTHLDRFGALAVVVRDIVSRHGVLLVDLLAGSRARPVSACRGAVCITLASEPFRWSQPAIARLLQIDHSSVGTHVRRERAADRKAA